MLPRLLTKYAGLRIDLWKYEILRRLDKYTIDVLQHVFAPIFKPDITIYHLHSAIQHGHMGVAAWCRQFVTSSNEYAVAELYGVMHQQTYLHGYATELSRQFACYRGAQPTSQEEHNFAIIGGYAGSPCNYQLIGCSGRIDMLPITTSAFEYSVALDRALICGKMDMVRYLLQHRGIRINRKQYLYACACMDVGLRIPFIQLLHKHQPDVRPIVRAYVIAMRFGLYDELCKVAQPNYYTIAICNIMHVDTNVVNINQPYPEDHVFAMLAFNRIDLLEKYKPSYTIIWHAIHDAYGCMVECYRYIIENRSQDFTLMRICDTLLQLAILVGDLEGMMYLCGMDNSPAISHNNWLNLVLVKDQHPHLLEYALTVGVADATDATDATIITHDS